MKQTGEISLKNTRIMKEDEVLASQLTYRACISHAVLMGID
jgi:hypothetical protein